MSTVKLDFSPGMFVRFKQEAIETGDEKRAKRLLVVGMIADGSQSDLYVRVSWWQKTKNDRLTQHHAELPRHMVARFTLPPNTPCTHKASGDSGLILCLDRLTESQSYRRYFVQFDDTVQAVFESDLSVVVDQVQLDPLDLLLDYSFTSPAYKRRRDRLIQNVDEVRHATFGLAELVTARLTLLAHQAEVVVRVLADPVCRYMLADEVGLGKTIEACLILCALRNQISRLDTVILAPAALLRQWQTELNCKFNLDFTLVKQFDMTQAWVDASNILVAYEDLETSEAIWQTVYARKWSMLIADEAHNLRHRGVLYERVRRLSRSADRALILTATPVQRRAKEYLDLLRLMHPAHYSAVELPRFSRMLETQSVIRERISYLARAMEPGEFNISEFLDEMEHVNDALGDPVLTKLVALVQAASADQNLAAAEAALRYVSDNYRIESRVIRNRRANLTGGHLPVRRFSGDHFYNPLPLESETLQSLHDYADACLGAHAAQDDAVEFCRMFFHAAASSSAALLQLLAIRTDPSAAQKAHLGVDPLLKHFANIARRVPVFNGEIKRLTNLDWHARRWHRAVTSILEKALPEMKAYNVPYRLAQVIHATLKLVRYENAKVLIFSSFLPTLETLFGLLEKLLGTAAVAEFSVRLTPEMLQTEADWFQKSDDCRVMLTDETGGEGRNFQVADAIIHVDLPWTPTQIEQRIGRVDRLGRKGSVASIVPIARGTIEEDLFNLWHKGYGIFEHSISGLEIALEELQDHVMEAFARNTRHGLIDSLPWLLAQAQSLRNVVEEERYFDEGAINWRKRRQFESISGKYQDGEWLREDVLVWAKAAQNAVHFIHNRETNVTLFGPAGVDLAAIAKLSEERQRQIGQIKNSNRADNVLIGTFHRNVAVTREDLTFFTLGQWHVDQIVGHARNRTRKRCCTIQADVLDLSEDWRGFEFLYSLSVDPHPLLAASLPVRHMRRIQGYLPETTMRVLVDINGVALPEISSVRKWIEEHAENEKLLNVGGSNSQIQQTEKLKRIYPLAEWQEIVAQAVAAGEQEVDRILARQCASRMAAARQELEQGVAGRRAAHQWLYGEADSTRVDEIRQLEEANAALLHGLEYPRRQLESICFWVLKAGVARG